MVFLTRQMPCHHSPRSGLRLWPPPSRGLLVLRLWTRNGLDQVLITGGVHPRGVLFHFGSFSNLASGCNFPPIPPPFTIVEDFFRIKSEVLKGYEPPSRLQGIPSGEGVEMRRFWTSLIFLPLVLVGCMAQGGNPDSSEIEADRFDEAQSLLSEIKEIENVLSDIKGEDLVGTRVDGEKRLRALLAETVGRQLDGGGSEGAELAENYSSEEISQARKVAASVRESVVVIAATWEESGSQYEGDATAWMVSPRVAITNDHNVRNQAGNPIDPSGVAIFDIQGNKYGVESFLILDREFDVAAILLDSDFPGPLIDLTLSSPAEVGDIVVVVGHPSQIGYWVQSIARVKLYQPGRDVFSGDGGVGGGSLQISLGISDGSSGSPVFNLSGNFVGILHSSPAITSDDLSGAPFNGGPLSVLPSQDESFGSSADDVIRIVGELTL